MPDIDASIMQAIDESYLEGLFVVEIEVRALEQAEEDWTGNIVAVVFGAVQIAVGAMLLGPAIGPALAALNAGTSVAAAVSAAGVGVFTTGFATGLIAGGIGDIIGSVSSFMKDAPLDVNVYFKSKAMGLAINIITSGTLHALQGFEVLRIGTAHESFWAGMGKSGMSHYMTKQVLFQAAMYGLNQVTQKQAKDYMDHNAGNIKQDATAAASSIVDDNYDPYLRRILAYDARSGTNAQASGITNDAIEVTNGYSTRFQGTGEQIARGAASGIAGGLLGGFGMAGQVASVVTNAATNIGFGLVKSAEASGEYKAKMRERIINRYNSLPGTKSQMLSYLEADPILRPDAIAIMNELTSLGFATADEINYQNCNSLNTLNLGAFNNTRATLFADCNTISGYMDITNNHAATRAALQKSLAEIFTSQLTGIFTGEVVMPAMSLPNGFIAGFAAEKLADAFKKEAKQEEAKPVTILSKAGKGKSSKSEAVETSEDQESRSHIRLRKPVDEKTMKKVVDRMLGESDRVTKPIDSTELASDKNKVQLGYAAESGKSIGYELRVHYDDDKSLTGHVYVELVSPNGESEFFGQNPTHEGWPIDRGFVKDEGNRFNEAKKNQATVITKSISIGKIGYEEALKYAQHLKLNPEFYTGHSGNDCVDFAQKIYAKTGSTGDFVDLYTAAELKTMGPVGASAMLRYGAGDQHFVAYGSSKEEVAYKYNVALDRVMESASICMSSLECSRQSFVIKPIITTQSDDRK